MGIGRLHVITDTTVQARWTHAELAELAIRGGADTIQYRSKSGEIRLMMEEAAAVRAVCRAHNVPFIVNDRVDLCLAVDADGVHLGLTDMPPAVARAILGPARLIGGTVRNVGHLADAVAAGVDYVGLGPVFGTETKVVGHVPLGLEGVRQVTAGAAVPVIAIAGISAANVADVLGAGAYGVAVIGAVAAAGDPEHAATVLAAAIARATGATT